MPFFGELLLEPLELQAIPFVLLLLPGALDLGCGSFHLVVMSDTCFVAGQLETGADLIAPGIDLSMLARAIDFHFFATRFFVQTLAGVADVGAAMTARELQTNKNNYFRRSNK